MEFLSNIITMKAKDSVYFKGSESQINYNIIDALFVTNTENRILLLYQKRTSAKIQKKSPTAFP